MSSALEHNLDFSQGEVGQVPTGWVFPSECAVAGYAAAVTDEHPKSGRRCAVIAKSASTETDVSAQTDARLLRRIDATPYRGKRIRFSGWARTDSTDATGRANAWLRVRRSDHRIGFSARQRVRSKDWERFEITGEVLPDAENIDLGLRQFGAGRSWLDDVAVDVVGVGGDGNEPPRALRRRGLLNLVAATRLLGYVRYFHPTRAVADTHWDLFAIDALPRIENAATPAALAAALQDVFHAVAPTVRVGTSDAALQVDPALSNHGGPVRFWEHVGVDVVGDADPRPGTIEEDQRSTFRSVLRTDASSPPVQPDRPLRAELGGGVSCLVPTAVAVAASRSSEGEPFRSSGGHGARPEHWRPSGNDRTTRLANIALVWNVFQHFYPYFDLLDGLDWHETLRRSLSAAAMNLNESEFLTTLSRLLADLQDDAASRVSHPGEPAPHKLPLAWDWIEDRLVVTRVDGDVHDLRAGDVVTALDGRATLDALKLAEETISASAAQSRRQLALDELASGAENSTLGLRVLATEGERAVTVEYRDSVWDGHAVEELRPAQGAELAPGVFYADLGPLQESEFEALVPRFANAKGLVFDLRGFPLTDPYAKLAHLLNKPVTFRAAVPVATEPDRRNIAFRFESAEITPALPRIDAPVAFITDGRWLSLSACVGLVDHAGLGMIVGAPTPGYGGGGVNPFHLQGDYYIPWTATRGLRTDGSPSRGSWIKPTVPVARTIAGVAAGRDELLERAVEVILAP